MTVEISFPRPSAESWYQFRDTPLGQLRGRLGYAYAMQFLLLTTVQFTVDGHELIPFDELPLVSLVSLALEPESQLTALAEDGGFTATLGLSPLRYALLDDGSRLYLAIGYINTRLNEQLGWEPEPEIATVTCDRDEFRAALLTASRAAQYQLHEAMPGAFAEVVEEWKTIVVSERPWR
ncbi:MAG: hypothetical protein R3B97_07800 [Dehalococcoidia bacterium]|nr:hypothetical protein [Dehalococcoidia bacterium]